LVRAVEADAEEKARGPERWIEAYGFAESWNCFFELVLEMENEATALPVVS